MQQLWPADYSPLVIIKIFLQFQAFAATGRSRKTQTTVITKWVDRVFATNANRACGAKPPMDHKATLDVAYSTLTELSLTPLLPQYRDPLVGGTEAFMGTPGGRGGGGGRDRDGANRDHANNREIKDLRQVVANMERNYNNKRPRDEQPTLGMGRGRGRPRPGIQPTQATPGQPPLQSQPQRQVTSRLPDGREICRNWAIRNTCSRATGPSCTIRAGTVLLHLCAKCKATDHGELACPKP